MKAIFNISTQQLDLSYESRIQELFRHTLERLRGFMGTDHIRRCDVDLQSSLASGFRLVDRLAQSRAIQTTAIEADCALDLVSFASRYLANDCPSARLVAQAVVALAKVTPSPCPAPTDSLPPSAHVFGARPVPPETRCLYEALQLNEQKRLPYLFVFQMYDLWFHLHKVSSPSSEFRALVAGLDEHTVFFRATISHLAYVDVSNSVFKTDE